MKLEEINKENMSSYDRKEVDTINEKVKLRKIRKKYKESKERS